jgi:hypothetical protein
MLVAAQPMSLLNVHFDTGFSPCTYSKYPTRCNFSHDGMALRESVRSRATPYFRLTALRLKLYAPHQSTGPNRISRSQLGGSRGKTRHAYQLHTLCDLRVACADYSHPGRVWKHHNALLQPCASHRIPLLRRWRLDFLLAHPVQRERGIHQSALSVASLPATGRDPPLTLL